MAFWSGEKLGSHLPGLIEGFKKENLDCASYRLSVGDQVFATSDKFASSSPAAPLVSVLKDPPENMLRIRPGQFAFLMTLERVRVPNDVLALISMRAGYKFKGLINVSGFHVDPGWEGKLLFSVYNAGPAEVIVERGEPMFLIVYADLDRMSAKVYNGGSKGQVDIKASLLTNMTEQVFSPLMLQRRMEEAENRREEERKAIYAKLSDLGTAAQDGLLNVVSETDKKLASLEITATSTAKTVRLVTTTALAIIGLVIAVVGLLVTIAPLSFGVTLAKTLEAAGYEMKQKTADSSSLSDTKKLLEVSDSGTGKPVGTRPESKRSASKEDGK